jgi:hypothetical protein
MTDTAPEGFTLDLERSREDEAAKAGITQRVAEPDVLVADEELDADGEDGAADDGDDEADE